MLIFVVTTLIVEFGLPLLIGHWMGKRARINGVGIMVGALRGLLLVFAVLYITGLQGDVHQWNTYWPSTSAYHMFGPDWSWNALVRAANPFKFAYLIFLAAFGIRITMRVWSKDSNVVGRS